MPRLVLIDRDGTINLEKHYLSDPDQITLISGAALGINLLKRLNLSIAVVTNQSAVGRGYFNLKQLKKINARLQEILLETGASVDAFYFCPHLPEEKCECRKPATGMARHAAEELEADLSKSFVIGDNVCDIELGKNIGATTILVRTGYGRSVEREGVLHPDYVTDNLLEAAKLIRRILEKE